MWSGSHSGQLSVIMIVTERAFESWLQRPYTGKKPECPMWCMPGKLLSAHSHTAAARCNHIRDSGASCWHFQCSCTSSEENHDCFAAAGNEIAFIGSSHGMLPQLEVEKCSPHTGHQSVGTQSQNTPCNRLKDSGDLHKSCDRQRLASNELHRHDVTSACTMQSFDDRTGCSRVLTRSL